MNDAAPAPAARIGRRTEAIRAYHAATGAGPAEAKAAVQALEFMEAL
ncbi:hypothetical protein [Streptomyces sp. NPDC002044]